MNKNNVIDCRAISEELMNDLKRGGFREFVNFIRENPQYKLALCFRGNDNPDSVIIYYNNHIVWKLNRTRSQKLKVTISFDHARYTEDWKEKLKILLQKYNFEKNNKNQIQDVIKIKADNSIEVGNLTSTSDCFDKDFVEGSFNDVLKPVMDDYFNDTIKKDFFKKGKSVLHRKYVEKIRQQELYLEFNNTENGLLIYDLEFAQKTVKDIQKSNNQPDMLGIEYENGKAKKLVLVEVKSTKVAVTGKKSGLIKHINGMEEYLEEDIAINNRMIEANKILEQYKELNLRNINCVSNISRLPLGILVILTDEAKEYFLENKNYYEKVQNGDSKNLSKILDSKGYEYRFDDKADRIIIYKKSEEREKNKTLCDQ